MQLDMPLKESSRSFQKRNCNLLIPRKENEAITLKISSICVKNFIPGRTFTLKITCSKHLLFNGPNNLESFVIRHPKRSQNFARRNSLSLLSGNSHPVSRHFCFGKTDENVGKL